MGSKRSNIERSNPEELVREGMEAGYGHWLEPIVRAEEQTQQEYLVTIVNEPAQAHRGRGRPRASQVRDESAIEKRRAQVRNAQRTYQKRKDNATASVHRRCDDLLRVLYNLSTDIEELLQTASQTGALDRKDELGKELRRMWSSYDTAISSPSVNPELRLLTIKNERRRAENQVRDADTSEAANEPAPSTAEQPSAEVSESNTASRDVDLDLGRIQESTLLQSFKPPSSLASRSIFDVVMERQAQLRKSESISS